MTRADGTRVGGRVAVVPPDVPPAIDSPRPALGVLHDLEAAPGLAGFARDGGGGFHLQALFVRDVGGPIRSYLLWRRLLAAIAAFDLVDATRHAHARLVHRPGALLACADACSG